MLKDPIVDNLLTGYYIRKRTDSPKLTMIIIESDNRERTSSELREKVKKAIGPNFFYGKVTGSSFRGGIEFQIDKRTVRFVFKETSSSKMGMNTALMEAAQCIYLAAAQTHRGPVTSTWVQQNINRIRQFFDVSSSIDKIFDALDDGWRKSSELIGNHLYSKLRHNNYVFHHDSQTVRNIYKEYSRLNRLNKQFSQSDKWNPADIWAIRRGYRPDFSKLESFDEFNSAIRDMIDQGNMVPISLKKVAKNPKVLTINTTEAIQKASQTTSIAAKTEFMAAKANTGRTNWMSSKNCKIEIAKGKIDMSIELRQSRPGAIVNGELKVKRTVARHGKIHVNQFARIFDSLGVKLETFDVRKINEQSENLDPVLIQQVYDMANKLEPHPKVTMEEFRKFINEHGKTDPDWLGSKYESLVVLTAFMKLSDADKHKAVERLYSQAAASNELAGPYLKVTERV
jgi:hypothetical protein